MSTTTYDVNVRYRLDDKASKGVGMIGREARKASRGIGVLSGGMRMLQTAAMGFFGFRAAKKHLIDYNSELQQARTTMGGLLMMNMGGKWATNQKRANKLIKQFQQDAKASTATTKDFVDFAGLITGPLSRAGASLEQIREVTKGGVIAAKAFGIEGEVAARDIEQALAGTLSKKDRFARALLEPMGTTTEKWNEMVKKTPAKAASALVKAFNQPAIKQMAKAQENSWAGVVSTFEDNFQRFMGAVGLPLMKELGNEIKGWNVWISKNQETVKQWARDFSKALVDGFRMVKNAVGFLIEHRHTLLMIAKAWAAVKIGGMFGDLAGGLAGIFGKGGIAGAVGWMTKFNLKGGTSVKALGGFAIALGLGVVAIQAWADAAMRNKEKEQKQIDRGERDNQFLRSRLMGMKGRGDFGAMADIAGAKTRGEWSEQHKSNARFIAAEVARMGIGLNTDSMADRNQFARTFGMDAMQPEAITAGMLRVQEIIDSSDFVVQQQLASVRLDFKQRMKANSTLLRGLGSYLFGQGQMDFFGRLLSGEVFTGKKPKSTTNINVNANISVVGDDPDRIAVGLVGAFHDMAVRGTQPRNPMRIR